MAQVGDVGLDFAWSKPSIPAIKAYGATFVSRYLCWLPSGKVITKAEYDSYMAAGIAVCLNWEYRATDQQGGASAGARHGAASFRQAQALGAPAGAVIYASADWDVQPAELPTCRAYWTAFAAALQGVYRFGVYGGLRAVADALAQGYHGWQTYAWSLRRPPDGSLKLIWSDAHFRQVRNGVIVGGADCDRDLRIRPDAGLIEGDDMALRDDRDFWYLMYRVKGLQDNAKTG